MADSETPKAAQDRKLTRIRHVVLALADAARAIESGKMEPGVGSALNSIYKTLLEAIRDREAAKLASWKMGKRKNPPKTMPGMDIQ